MEFAGSSLWNSSSLTIPPFSSSLDRYGASPLTPSPGFNPGTASSLVFIDAGVQDAASLLGSLDSNTAVYFLNPYQDAIGQITATLLHHTGVESVHILSHGAAGQLQLGNSWLSGDNLASYTQQLKSWGQALTADADILLYGCDVGQGSIGRSFLQSLAQLTEADVAASDNITGADGDWVLETQIGTINTASLNPVNYRYDLNTQLLSGIQTTLSSAAVGGSISPGMVSQNGQYVVFTSKSDGLVSQDNNGFEDVFLYDRVNNTYTLVSHDATNTNAGNGTSLRPVISGDGNYVAFVSSASNLVSGVTDNNNLEDIFLWERSTGKITLLSNLGGVTQAGSSTNPVINQDGSVVAFTSTASGLLGVPDRNGVSGSDVFVWTKTNGLELVSVNQNFNGSGNGSSSNPVVSADGNYVAFISTANDLLPGDNDGFQADVFVYGVTSGTFDQISINPAVAGSGNGTASGRLAISANGGRVAFATSSRLLATDTNTSNDIYVWDRATGNLILGSVSATGTQAGDNSSDAPVLSANGQYLAFSSLASNLVATGDTNGALDIYWRDLDSANPSRLISQVGGVVGNSSSLNPVMSDDGKTIVFVSSATNLIANDTNNRADAFAYNIDSQVLSLVTRQQGVTPPTVGDSGTQSPAISGDGKFVFFSSDATNLVPQDTNGVEDVFFTDLTTGAVSLVSRATRTSVTGNGNSEVTANQSISTDGRYVVFTSSVDKLVSGDTNGVTDIFLRDVTLPSSDPNAIKLVSRTTTGNAGNGASSTPMISGDGNFIVFTSSASDLVAGDTNNQADIFLYNRSTGTVQLISKVGSTLANGASANPIISNDGQYVVFTSTASNLVANDSNNAQDVFLWNRTTGVIQLVSKTGSGNSGNAASANATISANGLYVVFTSTASDLVAGDTNAAQDVFAFNTQTGAVTLLSTGASGIGNDNSFNPVISDDGRYVAFTSDATNLVANDTNGTQDVFRYDLQAASNPLALVSVNTSGNAGVTTGTPTTLGSYAPTMSADGNLIAFVSTASDLTTTTDTNGNVADVFIRNMQTGQTSLVSVNSAGTGSGNGSGSLNPVISADGRYVAFVSTASDLVTGDTNGNIQDVFVRDTVTGRTRLISLDESDINAGNAASKDPTLSRNAAYIAFTSDASNLVADDLNRAADVFGTQLKQTVSIVTQDGTATETAGDTGSYKVSRTDPTGTLIVKLLPKVTGTASVQDYDITTTTAGVTLVRDTNTGLITLTLSDNVKDVILVVTPIDDVVAEPTEAVELALVDDGGFLISSAAASASVSILDNDTVVTNTNDSGEGSLRQAILNANAFAGTNTITFQIPGTGAKTIALQSALPDITDTVIIDGTSQAGFTTIPVITLDGTAIATTTNGLNLTTNGNQVKGLKITNFKGNGIAIAGSNNTIGLGAVDTIGSNIITGNGQAGIAVTSGTGNRISGNSIGNNTGLGIDLGPTGVTPNDIGDVDTGANNLQNFPVSLVAENTIAGDQTIITGRLNGIAGRTIRVEFFSNTAADPSTNGEGETYLGFQDVTIDSSGFADISFTTTTAITGLVSATAIDTQSGDTSEFAVTVPVSKPEISIVPVVPSLIEGNTGTSGYGFDVVLSRASAQTVTVNVATQAGTATEGTDYQALAQTLTFAPGVTTQRITVNVIGDTLVEANETFNVVLSNPSVNATLATTPSATGTIRDDDTPQFSIVPSSPAITEGNSGTVAYTFTVSLSQPSLTPVSVDYRTVDGTAISTGVGADFVATTGTLNFAANDTTPKTITVLVNGDTIFEPNENFLVELLNPQGASLDSTASTATGVITNDDPAPVITFQSLTPSVTEGNSGTTDLIFNVQLSGASSSPISVDYTTQNGTALAGEDYTTVNGTLTFAPGETSKTITVKVAGDNKFEIDETLSLVLSNPTGSATIGPGNTTATGTITNDDARPTISFASSNVSTLEGNSGSTPATFTVNLSNPSSEVITVSYATQDGTATAGSDYTSATGTLTFNPGETSKDIAVQITGDTIVESNETYQVQLSGATNGTLSSGGSTLSATGTILDDDIGIAIVPLTISQPEGNSGTTNYSFKVQLSKPATQAVSVNYTTKDGTALAGEDYTAANGTLTFAAGETEKTITIQVNGDTKFEGDETFTLELSNAAGATITSGNSIGTATITNDDARPTISFASSSVSTVEGNSGNTPATFTVNLSNPSSEVVTVNYATQNGTATAGSDYTANTGTLTFNPGETSKNITIQVIGDTTPEVNETYQVQLSSATNGTFSGGGSTLVATGTITDDDAPVVPKVSITPTLVSKTEGNSGSQFYQFTIQLDQPTTQQVSVQYATVDGTAVSSGLSADYGGKSGTLIFAPGETSKTVAIEVFGDTNFEANETFKLQLSNPQNATLGTTEATGEILNDDAAPLPGLSVLATPTTVVEGNAGTTKTVTFTVSLSSAATQPVTVTYTTVDGTATSAGNDYIPVSGSLTFAPGETSKTVNVTVIGDNTVEPDEDFSLNLSNPTNAKIDVLSAFVTISNDDSNNGQPPTVSLGTGTVSLAEGNTLGSVMLFTITLSQPATQTVTVQVDTVDGTAIAGQDYVPISKGLITFNPGEQSKTFTVSTIGDTIPEPDETFDVRLSNPSNAVLGTLSQTGVIVNDDGPVLPTVSLGTTAITQNEGNSGTTLYTFTATLSQPASSTITVDYDTIDGTATVADNDYAPVSNGRLTFNAGETTKTFNIAVNGDTKVETNEIFKVQLKNPVGATIGTASQDGIIQNDDVAPSLSLSIVPTNAAQTEGNSGTKAFTFTVNLSQAATTPVTVNYATVDGTATVTNNDYGQKSGTLTFAAGETSKIITIDVNGDTVVEPDESFSVQLSNASGATISTASASGTIINDDSLALPTISIAPITLSQLEGNLGNRAYDFTVTLSQASTQAVTVNYAIQDGTATLADGDYVVSQTAGTLTFAPGETSKVITVNVVGDSKFEADETFTVRLSSPSNGILNSSATIATGTILNDDNAGMGTNLSVDGKTDVFWRNTNTGDVIFWQMNQGPSVMQYALNQVMSDPNWEVRGTADFDGDGDADILWRNSFTGANQIWRMNGTTFGEAIALPSVTDTNWTIEGIGNFTGIAGHQDILWRQKQSGIVQVWAMNGVTLVKGYSVFTIGNGDWVVEGTGDLNGDGVTDVVWRNQRTGAMTDWLINADASGVRFQSVDLLSVPDLAWKVAGIADFNGDRKPDILWRNYRTGENDIWIMNNGRYVSSTHLLKVPEASWVIKGISDFNKDGSPDILWQNQQTQEVSLWYMNRDAYGISLALPNAPVGWSINGVNDFGTDGKTDILWRDTKTGATYIWTIDSSTFNQTINIGRIDDLSWKAELTGDFNGDGKVDIFWRNQRTGSNIFWIMNNTQFVTSTAKIPQVPDLSWKVQGTADFDGDGSLDILWQNRSTGQVVIWKMDRDRYVRDYTVMTVPDLSWQIEGIADFDLDGKPDILWRNYRTGQTDIWRMNGFNYQQSLSLPLVSDITWRIEGIGDFNKDGRMDILWFNTLTRDVDIWTMNNFALMQSYRVNKAPSGNWQIQGIRDFNGDGLLDIFWVNPTTGSTQVWYMSGANYGSAVILPAYSDLNWRIEGFDDFRSGTSN
ncbi:Calx-beta domain-containing protein [Alkalinema pantanalense CENA528]|uniref:Calx-beta domain-containing protein n=1 Tax=Alkalinema pantanalense TaxID=1620705 RepID=UPI003D6E6DE1